MTLKEWIEENQDKVITITENGAIELNDPEQQGRWKPEQGDLFFYIIAGGEVHKGRWTRDLNDEMIYAMGNVFKTAKEAEDAAERLKIRAELLDCGGKEAREVILPVGNIYKYRYAIAINSNHSAVNYPTTSPRPFEITFETEAEVEAAIEKVGEDRIKKYLFGIED